jgi:hypothetical protein
MNKIIVFDLDGTICNVNHRRHWVTSKPKNWPAWNAGIKNDTPHDDIVWILKDYHDADHLIILCSGRSDDLRAASEDWLNENGIPFHQLYMRSEGDNRPDSIVKVELLDRIREEWGDPYLWFDDRNSVVDAIRTAGVRVLQVAPGDF